MKRFENQYFPKAQVGRKQNIYLLNMMYIELGYNQQFVLVGEVEFQRSSHAIIEECMCARACDFLSEN